MFHVTVYQDSKKQLSVDSDSLVVPRLDGNVRKALGMAPSNSCENLVANFEEVCSHLCFVSFLPCLLFFIVTRYNAAQCYM